MSLLLWSLVLEAVGCSEGLVGILIEGDYSLRAFLCSMVSFSGWVGRAEPARFFYTFKGDYLTSTTMGLGFMSAGYGWMKKLLILLLFIIFVTRGCCVCTMIGLLGLLISF